MSRRLTPIGIFLGTAIFLSAHTSTKLKDPDGLTVHEWGTFTSVAGEDGSAVEWLPQSGPSDVPCFVHRIRSGIKPNLSGTVRMETPVLYFYAADETAVDINVRFRQGVVTEWYPRAVVTPDILSALPARGSAYESTIAWKDVKVSPGASEVFPTAPGSSHYYAARQTDAAPLQVGSEREKLLFYRGVGRFDPPVVATIAADGTVVVTNTEGDAVGRIVLFENRGGRTGYRIGDAVKGRFAITPPALHTKTAPPYGELERMLIATGLYPKEARAMVETWRDSWFEEGARLFYFMSRRAIDAILPLEIDPAPTALARVFVGRIELVTPATLRAVRDAIVGNDRAALATYGRFLQPIANRVLDQSTPADRPILEQRLKAAYSSSDVVAAACN